MLEDGCPRGIWCQRVYYDGKRYSHIRSCYKSWQGVSLREYVQCIVVSRSCVKGQLT